MLRQMMIGKIHRATVTRADLDYVGSITVDEDLLKAANILPGQAVDVVDLDNGNRLTTYTIAGRSGSGEIQINGAAAHLVQAGHLVIIIAYGLLSEDELRNYQPQVVFVDKNNSPVHLGNDPGADPRH